MITHDVIVIGAGAAGLMCAAVTGGRGRKVLVLDHGEAPGRKILVSGGGRCNFTNLNMGPERFVSDNPHFATSALKRYTPAHFLELARGYGLNWHERKHGQLFCDDGAGRILDMLLAECGAGGVEIRCGVGIEVEGDGPFTVATSQGCFSAPALVVATGGLSIPKMGATAFAHTLARRHGLGVVEPRPGLVPFTFADAELAFCRALTGIAIDAVATCGKARFREAVLFTHRGLSGPAILQVSNYWRPGLEVAVDLLPGLDADLGATGHLLERKAGRPKAELKTVLAELLPARLAEALVDKAGLGGRPIIQLGDKALAGFAAGLKGWRLAPTGTEGWRTAEVTVGGVDTAGLSSKTMEAKARPGLFFIGEAVDVTGWLGGYNFQWAWSSGWVAGQFA